jgi:hypothetical protein
LNTLLRLTRSGLVDHDMLGLRPLQLQGLQLFTPSSGKGDKLRQFADWLAGAMTTIFLSDHQWLTTQLQLAYASGQRAAERFTKRPAEAYVDDSFQQQAVHELEGIIAATVQQASRSVAASIRTRAKPRVAYNMVSGIVKKIAGRRLDQLCNHFTVLLHNQARLDEFKRLGVRQIGVIPERLPGPVVRDHAHAGCRFHDLELVEILTAGDDLVCNECEDYADSGPYDIDEVELPLHLECRCAYVPTDDARFAEPEAGFNQPEEWFAA